MQIRDVLESKDSNVFTVQETASIMDVLKELNAKHIGALMVVNKSGGIEGIVSERDILKNIECCGMEHTVT